MFDTLRFTAWYSDFEGWFGIGGTVFVITPKRVRSFVLGNALPDQCNYDRPVHLDSKNVIEVINTRDDINSTFAFTLTGGL